MPKKHKKIGRPSLGADRPIGSSHALPVKMCREDYAAIKKAALLSSQSMSELIRSAARREANRILRQS